MHPILSWAATFSVNIYGRVRRFVKTWSGRKRYNVLGAMDFVTKKVHTVANDSYITATEICEMLKKLRVEYTDGNVIEGLKQEEKRVKIAKKWRRSPRHK